MSDIIVTTPKHRMADAAREAADCIAAGGGYYFRRFPLTRKPASLKRSDRIFYVEDGYVRGYAVVDRLSEESSGHCHTTGKTWGGGLYVWMRADSWKWIEPIPMTGFQGYRYAMCLGLVNVVGGWLDPKPQTPNPAANRP